MEAAEPRGPREPREPREPAEPREPTAAVLEAGAVEVAEVKEAVPPN